MIAEKIPVVSFVREYNGMPAIFLNDKPVSGLMHWNRWPKPEDIAVFRDSGIHLYSFMGIPPMRCRPEEPAVYSDGLLPVPELTHDFLTETFSMLEETDPQMKVLMRFRITPPLWWRKAHPEKMIRVWDWNRHQFRTEPHASVSDAEWMEYVRTTIEETVEYLEGRWPHLIFGYHPGLACCCENAYTWGNALADYSEPHKKAFRIWLKTEYKDINTLNSVWETDFHSFDMVEPPAPSVCMPENSMDKRTLLTFPAERGMFDFRRFTAETMAEAVVFQAKIIKNTLKRMGRTKICGAFYGYVNTPTNQTDLFCSGHLAQEKVLSSPEIDFLCAPLGYSARQIGGTSISQLMPASVVLHGKLYYAEEDTRFHRAKEDEECVSGSPGQTEALLLRNFAHSWSSGGSIWWMDLFGRGWYREKSFIKPLSFCRNFAARHLSERESCSQIAVFISEESLLCERAVPTPLSGQLIEQQLCEFTACGAPFDSYRLEDLPLLKEKHRLEQYRLTVIAVGHSVNSSLLSCIQNELCSNGRTVVFFYLPGYIRNGTADLAYIRELTGIQLESVFTKNGLLTESYLNGQRFVFGNPSNLNPCPVAVSDKETEILGHYMHGTIRTNYPGTAEGGAFVRKRFKDWSSVWCASPGLPAVWLSSLAAEAGVHIWTENGSQVFTGPGWFAAAARYTGIHRFRLPVSARVTDAVSGQCLFEDVQEMEIRMERGECRIFELN